MLVFRETEVSRGGIICSLWFQSILVEVCLGDDFISMGVFCIEYFKG